MKLIKIYATWCEPCKRLTAQLKELGVKTEDYDVDTPEGIEMISKSGSTTVPVLMYGDKLCTSSKPDDVLRFLEEINESDNN